MGSRVQRRRVAKDWGLDALLENDRTRTGRGRAALASLPPHLVRVEGPCDR